MTKSSQWTYN